MCWEAAGQRYEHHHHHGCFTLPTNPQPGLVGTGVQPGVEPIPYLIVDHNVHCAVGGVGRQVTQMEGLIDDTLASKGGIPMDQDGHDLHGRV